MKKHAELLERGNHIWSDDSIRLILTPGRTAKTLYFYAQEAGYFKTEYPYYSERQNLDSFLIVYTVSGEGILEYQGTEYTVTRGDCFLIHCEEHHLYRTAKGKTGSFCGSILTAAAPSAITGNLSKTAFALSAAGTGSSGSDLSGA